jgi:hypothetical protein
VWRQTDKDYVPNEVRMIMESTEIIHRIEDTVKMLPRQKLKIALDFLEDLKQSNEEETQILLNDAGFMEEYRQAKDDIQSGNTISWKDIRRDV